MARKNKTGGSEIERVPTGIPGLDPLIEGGLPQGSVTLVTGSAGTCKKIFGLQYLVSGAMKGEKGIYINFDEEKSQLYAQAMRFGWDLNRLEKEGKIEILNFDMTKTHVVNVIIEMEAAVKKLGPERLVLDSISVLGIYSQVSAGAELSQLLGVKGDSANMSMNEIVSRGAVMGIVSKIRGLGPTSIIISELPEESQWLSRDTVSEFVCDGVIKLSWLEALNKRTITVKKLRATANSLEARSFSINNKGVVVEKE